MSSHLTRQRFLLTALGTLGCFGVIGRLGFEEEADASETHTHALTIEFSELARGDGWSRGRTRFMSRFPGHIEVSGGVGTIDLPKTLGSAGSGQPLPVFLLDHDTPTPAQTITFTVADAKTKPGLLIGATSIFEFYGVSLEGGDLVLARYEHHRRTVLHRSAGMQLKRGVLYELDVRVGGGRVRARVGHAGRVPTRFQLNFPLALDRGMPGVFLVGDPATVPTKVLLRRYRVGTTVSTRVTPMRPLYLVAGAPHGGETAVRVGAERSARVVVEWSTSESFTSPSRSREMRAGAFPYTARTSVPTPATVWWRAVIRDPVSGARCTTPPQQIAAYDSTQPLVMGAASCAQLWDADEYVGLEKILEAAAPHQPTMLVYQGDFGYPSNDYASCLETTEAFYADRITRFLSDSYFKRLRARMPVTFTMDDHEYGPRNNANRRTIFPWTVKLWNAMHANPTDVGYCEWRHGDVHCLTLDGRRYSDPAAEPESSSKTKLGLAQKAWLKEVLQSSSANLFLVFSADIFATRGDPTVSKDCWIYGWATEYAELMSFFHLVQLNGKRVVIISGDAHGMRVHHHPDPQSRPGTAGVVEFICAGLRARSWSMEHPPDPTVDPTRRVSGHSGLGMIQVDPAGTSNRQITLRAITGESAGPVDLFPPLPLSFTP